MKLAISVPEGSEIVSHEDYEPPDRNWSPKNITLFVDEEQGDSTFKGSTLLFRMKQRERALGAHYLDWLLKNPKKIPTSWASSSKNGDRFIFFWGTQYQRTSDGQIFIRYLYQSDNGLWREGRHFLNDVWPSNCMAAEWKK
jgi:hypothetical protein